MLSRWMVRLSDVGQDRDVDAFAARFAGLGVLEIADGEIWLDDPDSGRVVFHPDGRAYAEGRVIDPATWTHAGKATRLPGESVERLPSQAGSQIRELREVHQ